MTAPPTEPGESIPTEQDALVAYLVNFYRYSVAQARAVIESQKDGDELPEAIQHRA